ncbi:hypothetical protein DL762_006731 [Monosporascus cannonballus]|uniref:DUF2293 domain-containing protein n=1 Tax=Monosporascus cannonballus TaxID=155416 RepID=A0ABY0H297_9PEZI|nr:hypothetical protein DL762_006731 [Monosporascus cannonballus]RYO95774.1 hypothetical protein DL763_003554 [Monosporascus cannonballus]
MARDKKKVPASAKGSQALARRIKRDRAQQYSDHIWQNLNPLKQPPKVKHKTYFESVENTDKKKRLEFEITTDRHPPPGFEFIATGNPDLTTTCKELSREQDAMIFIVSDAKNPDLLEHHMNRVGYHFRQTIVEQARAYLIENGKYEQAAQAARPGEPEPIPESQRDINRQADAVLRDLFPRIPNIDRQEIIQHAFKKDGKFHGDYKVGMAKDLTLARRVQLAALAYIRHTKTRYDELLKETDWANARKAVEKPCLDIIVKWRGDEETGRDQLDEILREVIEISDSEDDSEYESSSPEHVSARNSCTISIAAPPSNDFASRDIATTSGPALVQSNGHVSAYGGPISPARQNVMTRTERKTSRKAAQRFRRYAAVAESIAHEHGQNGDNGANAASHLPTPMVDLTSSPPSHQPGQFTRETLPATYCALSPRHASTRVQLGPERAHFPSNVPGEVTSRRSHGPSEDHSYPASPGLVRISESQRPKVGPSVQHDHSRSAVSPITTGLQDMLLPSIEPRSPTIYEPSQYGFRSMHHEYRENAEAPRIITRTDQPGAYVRRARSPALEHVSDKRAPKRSRIATYFPEDYDVPPRPFIPLSHASTGHGSRLAPLEYASAAAPEVQRDENRPPGQAVVVPTREYLPRGREEVPLRTRANPIAIGDDRLYRQQPVVEGHLACTLENDPTMMGQWFPTTRMAMPLMTVSVLLLSLSKDPYCLYHQSLIGTQLKSSPVINLFITGKSRRVITHCTDR